MPQKIPINQLNALPLTTAASVGNPGTTIINGNAITQYWSPAQTGINGTLSNVADPTTPKPAGQAYVLSDWIDARGFTRFTAMLVGKASDIGGIIALTANLRIIPYAIGDAGPVEPAPALPGPDSLNLLGTYGSTAYPYVGSLAMPAFAGGKSFGPPPISYYRSSACSWQVGSVGSGPQLATGMMGTMRLWISITAPAPDPHNLFLSLWAQT